MPTRERSAGNQRRYDKAALDRLSFIRHARELGLPLADIAALISLEGASGANLTKHTRSHADSVMPCANGSRG